MLRWVQCIMRYLKLKKFYADYVLDDNGIVLEQDTNTDFSWWANDILQTEAGDVLQQEDDTASSVKYSYLSAFTNTAYQFITNNLYDTGLLDIDGDGKINKHDLKMAFRSMKREISNEEVDDWIQRRDSTGTGAVNFVDFMANYS